MIVAEYEGFKDILKSIESEIKKGIKKVSRIAIPMAIGRAVGIPKEQLQQMILAKELQKGRKQPRVATAQTPVQIPVPQSPQAQPSQSQSIMPILLIAIPALVSLIFILRRR